MRGLPESRAEQIARMGELEFLRVREREAKVVIEGLLDTVYTVCDNPELIWPGKANEWLDEGGQ